MSFFCIVGGKASTPFPESELVKEMLEDRYFKPGIIHGGKDYLIRVYLNDSHAETSDDHNQFEVDYITADLILAAADEDPTLGEKFNNIINDQLENFCVTSMDKDFCVLANEWHKAVSMTNEDLLAWAKSVEERYNDKKVNKDRLETMLIAAIEHAVECSEQHTHDLLKAIGISSEELEAICYDKENYPKMHEWIAED